MGDKPKPTSPPAAPPPSPSDETPTSPTSPTSPTTPAANAPAASSAASEKGSASSRRRPSGLVGDAGPTFNAERAGDAPPPAELHALPEPLPGWEEPQVRTILGAQGLVVHNAIAVEKEGEEWVYTKAELDTIAPPLTRILNRYDATRAAAGTGDELALVIGLTGYVGRSWVERRRALALLAAAEEEPQPITGIRPDEPPAVPGEEDLQWTTPES
jgi:hypothetical protein